MDNQRPLLYLALVFVLFLIWQAWQADYGPRPPQAAQQAGVPADPSTGPAQAPADVPAAADRTAGAAPLPVEPAGTAPSASRRIRVVTDVLDLEIDTLGGDLRRVDLPTYPVSLDQPDVPVRLLDDRGRLYVAQSGLVDSPAAEGGAKGRAPTHHEQYTAEQSEYRLPAGVDELRVPLLWSGPDGLRVVKTYVFHRGSFLIDVEHRVDNGSALPWSGRLYTQLRHGPVDESTQQRFIHTYTGSAYYDGKYTKLPFDKMADEPLSREITGGWAAMLQHYFLSAWIPVQNEQNHYYSNVYTAQGVPQYIIGVQSPPQTVEPGASAVFKSRFYVGPKLQERLGEIAEGLDLTVDYGIFTILSKPLFWLLELIHDLVGNWGWAIVIVTLLIKLAFYKLSETSYRSMARMRAVQPKLQALKERYGDDKQRLNQALMDLYRTEKINPLGGCLPIVIQIPVFIAFYWMLLESVEMRQAPWILWINDLSTKDPYYVLPVLMGLSMFAQQRLNPQPIDPVQQKVFMLMPVMFTVFFAFFPSGLVLYWLTNNLLSIAQQWLIMRRMEGKSKR